MESKAGLAVEQCVDRSLWIWSEEDASGDESEVVSLKRIETKDRGIADKPWRGTT